MLQKSDPLRLPEYTAKAAESADVWWTQGTFKIMRAVTVSLYSESSVKLFSYVRPAVSGAAMAAILHAHLPAGRCDVEPPA